MKGQALFKGEIITKRRKYIDEIEQEAYMGHIAHLINQFK